MNKSMSLFLLQNCDQTIDSHRAIITQNERALQDFTLRDGIIQELNKVQIELSNLNSDLAELEAKINSTRIKAQQSNSSLYSGKIRNPKELQDLESEIKHLNHTLSQMEEQQLDSMIIIETQNTALKEIEQRLEVASNEKRIQDQSLLAEISAHKNDLQNVMTERTALVASIDAASLEKYEKLRVTKAGIAVTRVDENTCEKCGAEITQAVWQKARISSELCFCDTCGRIIYAR
jgi:uncharacterized protein